VTLSAPSNDWLYRMTTHLGAMFSKTGVADLANKPIGTGPYTFTSWNRGDSITLTRNDSYWGTKPYYQTVVLKYFKDATALNNALLTGAINVVTTVQAPEALASSPPTRSTRSSRAPPTVRCCCRSTTPTRSSRTRRSVRRSATRHRPQGPHGHLLGRQGHAHRLLRPADRPVVRGPHRRHAVRQGQGQRAAHRGGQDRHDAAPAGPDPPVCHSCGQVVKSQLEAVGFKVELDQLEFPAAWLTQVFKGGDFDMSIVAHVEPRDMKAVFGNPDYYTHYGTAEIQALSRPPTKARPKTR
jgi:peptide/nickel transport system substrate-binding protein